MGTDKSTFLIPIIAFFALIIPVLIICVVSHRRGKKERDAKAIQLALEAQQDEGPTEATVTPTQPQGFGQNPSTSNPSEQKTLASDLSGPTLPLPVVASSPKQSKWSYLFGDRLQSQKQTTEQGQDMGLGGRDQRMFRLWPANRSSTSNFETKY
jgi:hypothetical protein